MLCVQCLHKYCLYMHTYMFMDIICMYGRRQKFGHILFLQNSKSFLFLCKNVQKWNRMESKNCKNVKMAEQNARC